MSSSRTHVAVNVLRKEDESGQRRSLAIIPHEKPVRGCHASDHPSRTLFAAFVHHSSLNIHHAATSHDRAMVVMTV
jgi:hypothetical protein